MNILIIEDNNFLAEKIKETFEKNIISNRVKILNSYNTFLNEIWNIKSYDIILIDILLWLAVEKTWIDIIKIIRKKKIEIPIVIISSYWDISWLKIWFNAWASDYLIKPFRLQELEIRTLNWFEMYLSKTRYNNKKTITYNDINYNFQNNEFYFKQKKILLSKKSKYLLSIFISKPEQLILETELIQKIWWDIELLNNRNLRIVILRLKRSLKLLNIDSRIHNIRWEWYILKINQ